MKKYCLLVIAYFAFVCKALSQDIITQKTGEDIKAKVLEVTLTEIKYKKFDNIYGPTDSISKSDVFRVIYENGTIDVFNKVESLKSKANTEVSDDMRNRGKRDAQMQYTGQRSGAGWTAATTILLSPLLGVIPAAACASTEPSEQNLNYSNTELMKDYGYNRAYVEEAHKIKKRKIWRTYGISSGVWLIIILLL